MRAIHFSPSAFRQLEEWGQRDRRRQQKLLEPIQHTARDPFTGLGKPEPLRHQFSGCWSRRIDGGHRLIYRVTDKAVEILACEGHY